VLERVRSGQVLFTYVPLQTGSVPNAQGAARAALCAGQQAQFWEMHDVLFDWQTRYGNTAFSQNRLLTGVEQLGLNGSAFTDCFNSAAISNTLAAALEEGVSVTPTLRVNGVTLEADQGLPSTAAIEQAIDDATPDDWGRPSDASLPAPETQPTATTASAPEAENPPTEAPAPPTLSPAEAETSAEAEG